MTTEEQRKQNRERQQRHREKKRQASYIPTADEMLGNWPAEQEEQLNAYKREVSRKVAEELGREIGYCGPEDYVLDHVARTLYAFNKGWTQQVSNPDGVLVGGCFPDVLGSGLVSAAHVYGLKKSETFSQLYRELLEILDQRYGKNNDDHAKDIRAELNGTYVLESPETKPEPKPELPVVQPEPLFNRPSRTPSQQIESVR